MTADVSHSDLAIANANGIEIAYDTFGDPHAPPLVLIMGLGFQMIVWDEEFCKEIADRGYWVIRFDNRDTGLSTRFDEAEVPDVFSILEAKIQGKAFQTPYTLSDMADDTVGLLNELKIDVAHMVGLSMGGMIAQMMAVCHPSRVQTLTAIMSSTGAPGLPPPTPEALSILLNRLPSDRTGYIEGCVQIWQILSGPNMPADESRVKELAGHSYDRGLNPAGFSRQLAAIITFGSIKEKLESVNVPTLVLHGDSDPLIPLECGLDIADSIRKAKMIILKGMGHALHRDLWPRIIDAIEQHAL